MVALPPSLPKPTTCSLAACSWFSFLSERPKDPQNSIAGGSVVGSVIGTIVATILVVRGVVSGAITYVGASEVEFLGLSVCSEGRGDAGKARRL